MLLDAVLGTGFKGRPDTLVTDLINFVNGLRYPVLSVDIPSGLNGDTGKSAGACIKAVETVTMYARKKGMLGKKSRSA